MITFGISTQCSGDGCGISLAGKEGSGCPQKRRRVPLHPGRDLAEQIGGPVKGGGPLVKVIGHRCPPRLCGETLRGEALPYP